MTKVRQIAGLLAALMCLAVSACTGPSGGDSGGPTGVATMPLPPTSGPAGIYPKAADPLPKASMTTDKSRAVTREASWRRDTSITTKGADGTTYTLSIPRGALLSDVRVTMTPVTKVSGLPLSGRVGGVELRPHGLMFQQPVRLTVTPKAGLPSAPTGGRIAAVAADKGGVDPHGYGFANVEQRAVTLNLNHFSFYYVGAFSPGDLQAILLHVPSATDAQVAQDMFGADSPEDVFTAWYNDIVDPALRAAEADLDRADQATVVALTWLRQAALAGAEPGAALAQATMQRLVELQLRVSERASERCRTSHDIRQVGTIIGAARALALLGHERAGEVAAAVNGCLRIEFDLEERIEVKADYTEEFMRKEASGSWHFKTEQYVIEDWLNEEPELPTPWVGTPSYRHKQSIKCPSGSGRTDDQLNLTDSPEPRWHVNLRFDFNPYNDPTHDAGSAVHGTLELTPIESSTKETAEVSQVDCSDSDFGRTMKRALWASRFVAFREGESDTPTSISLPIEAGPGDPIIAEMRSSKTLPDVDDPPGTMTETLTVRIIHNP